MDDDLWDSGDEVVEVSHVAQPRPGRQRVLRHRPRRSPHSASAQVPALIASSSSSSSSSSSYGRPTRALEIDDDSPNEAEPSAGRPLRLSPPQPADIRARSHHHHHHHRRHHHHHRHLASSRASPAQRPPAQRPPAGLVIDLTEEPDVPGPDLASQPQSQGGGGGGGGVGRNPRRTNSQRISPPTLARSDGTLSFGRPPTVPDVIDLTADSPEGERAPPPLILPHPEGHRRHHLHRPPHHHHHHHHRPPHMPDALVSVGLIQGTGSRFSADIRGLGRRLAGYFGNADLMSLNAFGRQQVEVPLPVPGFHPPVERESPKPPMEVPPDARTGFTRDTCAEPTEEDETTVVCPCCGEELAYDPADQPASHSAPVDKRRKRAPGEHHFWALKRCGHVYCAECFENRRPTKAQRRGAGFPTADGSTPTGNSDLRCAVEGCETKVVPKGEWVGIFL